MFDKRILTIGAGSDQLLIVLVLKIVFIDFVLRNFSLLHQHVEFHVKLLCSVFHRLIHRSHAFIHLEEFNVVNLLLIEQDSVTDTEEVILVFKLSLLKKRNTSSFVT